MLCCMETIHTRIKQARLNAGMTQAQLAEQLGVTPQSVQQWEGTTSPKRNRLVTICSILGVDLNWVLSGEDGKVFSGPNIDDYAFIPQYTAHGECGLGKSNDHVEIQGTISFKKSWLSAMSLKPENLVVIYADGDSMAPTISDGAVVLIDLSKAVNPVEGKVYAVRRSGDSLIIKRLSKSHSGWIYRSDNPNKSIYPDIEALADDVVIGRVVWQGGNSGL